MSNSTLDTIRREFIEGSAIAPDVFDEAIALIPDITFDPYTNEVESTPIDDALGWKYTRFTHQSKPNQVQPFFINEDGSVWQAKLYDRSVDGRSGQYTAPKGIGDKPYFPPVPARIAREIAEKHGIEPPAPGESFWERLKTNPSIPLVITEGGKKALSLISIGIPAIALYGCRCGAKRKDSDGREVPLYLIPELVPYVAGREVVLAFDRDTKPKAKTAVTKGIYSLSIAIQKAGGSPHVATWDTRAGKGIDDVIAGCGSSFATGTIESAVSFENWKTRKMTDLGDRVNHRVNTRYLTLESLAIPETAQLICIKSPKGTGKSQLMGEIARSLPDTVPVYPITHRVTLSRELSEVQGVSYRTDRSEESSYLGYGLVFDSLHPGANPPVNPDDLKFFGAMIPLDEIEQSTWHLLTSDTLDKTRPLVIETSKKLLRTVIETGGKIFLTDADLSPLSIDFIKGLIGDDLEYETYIVENTYQREEKRPLYVFEKPEENFSALTKLVSEGKKAYITTGSQGEKSQWGTINLEKNLKKRSPDLRILRIDRETVDDPSHPAYKCTSIYRDAEGKIIQSLSLLVENYDVLIVSPTLETGVSIVTPHFDAVFGFFCGTQTVNGCCQSLERVRADIPRYIYAPKRQVIGMVGNGSENPNELARSTAKKAKLALSQLHEIDAIAAYDDENPICLKTWSEYGAIINSQARNYLASIEEKLLSEGYEKKSIDAEFSIEETATKKIAESVKETRDESWQAECQAIAETPNPTDSELEILTKKTGGRTKKDIRTLNKSALSRRYATEEVTREIVDQDSQGWFGKIALHYFLTEGESFLQARDREKIVNLAKMNDGRVFAPDISSASIGPKVACLKFLEIDRFLNPERTFTNDNLTEWRETKLFPYRRDIKTLLGITINENDTPIRGCQRILATMGLKLVCVDRKGQRGNQVRFYQLESINPDGRGEVFQRWFERDSKMYQGDTVATEPIIYIDPPRDPVATDRAVATEPIDLYPPSPVEKVPPSPAWKHWGYREGDRVAARGEVFSVVRGFVDDRGEAAIEVRDDRGQIYTYPTWALTLGREAIA